MPFPGGPAMAMPPHGAGLAGQQPRSPAPADAQNPGSASAAAPGATYEAKIEIAHKHAADAASKDAKRACQPNVNVPFADLDDAIARLLPYHVFSAADEDELDESVVPPIKEDDGKRSTLDENENENENAPREKRKATRRRPRTRSRLRARARRRGRSLARISCARSSGSYSPSAAGSRPGKKAPRGARRLTRRDAPTPLGIKRRKRGRGRGRGRGRLWGIPIPAKREGMP
jgi:hypothetical protein